MRADDYQRLQRLVREIRKECQNILDQGHNPDIVIKGYNKEESEAMFEAYQRIRQGCKG